jgi:hypothetical protein
MTIDETQLCIQVVIQRQKNNPRNGDAVLISSKDVQDAEVIKQGVSIHLLGQKLNFS